MAASLNDTHIIVTWSPPLIPNGVVSYIINVQRRSLLTNTNNTVITDLTVTELEVSLENPEAFSDYSISVTSQTVAGTGVTQTVVIQTPQRGTFVCNRAY